ncbi:MAG: hypothetical protein KF901_17770 [Myxococcales bacterium]|nr:hypothetical protein [Myxococcales bacterium]
MIGGLGAGTHLGDVLGLSPTKAPPPLDVFLAKRQLELGGSFSRGPEADELLAQLVSWGIPTVR